MNPLASCPDGDDGSTIDRWSTCPADPTGSRIKHVPRIAAREDNQLTLHFHICILSFSHNDFTQVNQMVVHSVSGKSVKRDIVGCGGGEG